MSLQVSIDDRQIRKLNLELKKFSGKALQTAQQQAINRTASGLQTFINRKIREERKLKAGEIKKQFMKIDKARKGRLIATVTISGRVIPLIRFIKGSKSPRKQKGIAVRRRKELKAEIDKGHTTKMGSAFIAKDHKGKNQVFRRHANALRKRRNSQKGPIGIQMTPSLAVLISRQETKKEIVNETTRRLGVEFVRAFRNQLSKIKTL